MFSDDFSEEKTQDLPSWTDALPVSLEVPPGRWDNMTDQQIKEFCND